eukprot:1161092-Pelagomonas_calceolata.AAC.1
MAKARGSHKKLVEACTQMWLRPVARMRMWWRLAQGFGSCRLRLRRNPNYVLDMVQGSARTWLQWAG